MTFQVGDHVVFPPHGAGVIREIVEREVAGTTHEYFRIDFVRGDLAVLVPVGKGNKVGLRKAIEASEVEQLKAALEAGDVSLPETWQVRSRLERDIISRGYAHQVAALIGALDRRQQERGLAATESELLAEAKLRLAGEVALVLGLPWERAQPALLDELLAGTLT